MIMFFLFSFFYFFDWLRACKGNNPYTINKKEKEENKKELKKEINPKPTDIHFPDFCYAPIIPQLHKNIFPIHFSASAESSSASNIDFLLFSSALPTATMDL